MNTTGGPHILLFERDQQLTALLMSELQLAGFECHAARTAVEVFDTIARFPVRMVLVDLAQAAAGRREFWVALDTQRRGRGVQVFTFHCYNIAGYGPPNDDSDDRQQTILADMEVDGMAGIMNLVNTVRSRLLVSNTGSMSRLSINAESPTMPVAPVRPPAPSPTRRPTPMPPSAAADITEVRPAMPTSGDSIRAVIYPGQRPWNAPASYEGNGSNGAAAAEAQIAYPAPALQRTSQAAMPMPAQQEPAQPDEPGLAQLSRMIQDRQAAAQDHSMPLLEELARGQRYVEEALPAQAAVSEATPMSTIAMRASPIEDLPSERPQGAGASSERVAYTRPAETHVEQDEPPALLSISFATPTSRSNAASAPDINDDAAPRPPAARPFDAQPQAAARATTYTEQPQRAPREETGAQTPAARPVPAAAHNGSEVERVEDNAVLLDIMQSLPPMPAAVAPPQPQVLSGRATRALGSVLLEGHLVPQDRLDVAQNIQRMLRGVDMNYQLGEILLMFKLLTPDQLLAASLVSYGLLTTTQIRALGRIRQELHSIGLEYDLENLLILFRILTSEQLREVRASWSG